MRPKKKHHPYSKVIVDRKGDFDIVVKHRVAVACEYLNISRSTLFKAMKAGLIEYQQPMPRLIWFTSEQINAYQRVLVAERIAAEEARRLAKNERERLRRVRVKEAQQRAADALGEQAATEARAKARVHHRAAIRATVDRRKGPVKTAKLG